MHSFVFPSLKTLGEDLVTVLDFLHVKYVIGLGEGAGANVLARYGLAHPSRCLGLILINCTGSAASVIQSFKTKVRSNGINRISNYGCCVNSQDGMTLMLILSQDEIFLAQDRMGTITSGKFTRDIQFGTLNSIRFWLQFITWKGDEVAQSAEDFLLYHKFGHVRIHWNSLDFVFFHEICFSFFPH